MIGSFDEQGNLLQHHSYDPFGKPRDGRLRDNFTYNLTSNALSQPIGANILGSETTNRGFTDHEHLDDAQLIHMNGRVYDYNLGRFLSVDPFIQAPGNSQSMNPYSYIMNNPLAGTDPSGYAADIDQDKLEVKVTSQSRTRSAPTGSRIKRDTSRTITATVTDESGTSSNYVYTAARNGSERAFKIATTTKLDNTDLGSKGQVGVGTNGETPNQEGVVLNSASHLSISKQREAWKEISDAVRDLGDRNIAKTHEGVGKILTEKLYDIGSPENYNIEMAAEIIRVDDGWGFTQLRTQFLSSQVSNDPLSSIGWHNHPSGSGFSGFKSVLGRNRYGGDIRNGIHDAAIKYVARSSKSMDRFNFNSYVKHIEGWKYDAAVEYRNKVILNKGAPHVDEIKF